MGIKRICPICKKIFYSGIDWGYMHFGDYLCSYPCLLKAQEMEEGYEAFADPGGYKRGWRNVFYDTKQKCMVTMQDVADEIGYTPATVCRHIKRLDKNELLYDRYKYLGKKLLRVKGEKKNDHERI